MKKKLTLVVTCIVLVAAMVIGGTLAYFTDKTDSAKNTFTMGNVRIMLDEAVVTKDGDKWTASKTERTSDGNDYKSAYPGAVLPKDPTVHNTGNNDAYVRVKVTMTQGANALYRWFPEEIKVVGLMPDVAYCNAFTKLVGGEFGDGWVLKKCDIGNELQFTLEYTNRLAVDAQTTPVFENLYIPATYDSYDGNGNYENFGEIELDIVAEAIQAAGFVDTVNDDGTTTTAMENAWAAFDA